MKASSILGLNARSFLYTSEYNSAKGKRIAQSKILTYKYLKKAGIPTPEIYATLKEPRDIEKFDWEHLPGSFVLKPSKSLGGEGIIVVKKKAEKGEGWITTQRRRITIEDLKLHILDIMEGAHSVNNVPDIAIFQEFVGRHKSLIKYSYRGTPDIRVIVFNKVPVMAMLRLPTKESGGRANLHQGAIAAGIDIATGITTKAILHGEYIKYKPGTKRKLHGIKIPHWNKILEIAIRCQDVTGLGYLGADIVLHPSKGPMVLEINNQPGLSIQLANSAGLRRRLERIEDLEIIDADHGIKVSKALFSGPFADKVRAEEGVKTLRIFEEVKVRNKKTGKKVKIKAKIDTGAWRSSIDRSLARELGLLEEDNVLWHKKVKSSLGIQKRPIIDITFWLKGKKINTTAGVANRKRLKYDLIIGRRDLAGFLVDPIKKSE